MNITEIRQQYPEYDDLDDQQLAKGFHQKYYSDLPFEEFSHRIGLNPDSQPAPVAPGPQISALPEQPSLVQRVLSKLFGADTSAGPEAQAQAIIHRQAEREGLTSDQLKQQTLGREDLFQRALNDFGGGGLATLDGLLGYTARLTDNPETRNAIRNAQESIQVRVEDLFPDDPKFIDNLVAGFGSTASFFVPGIGIVKGASAVANVAPRMALWLGSGAAGGLEAAVEAGVIYDELKRQGLSDEEAAAKADAAFFSNAAFITVTNKLGIFGDKGNQFLRRTLGAVFEGGQEAGQQIISNVATDKPLFEGVPESAAIGSIVGGSFAGNINVNRASESEQKPEITEQSAAPPPVKIEPQTKGNEREVFTPAGNKVITEFAVIEADQLITSNDETGKTNPNFPAELQPRDRSRKTSDLQINKIANDLKPELLGDSATVTDGAPIIGPDGIVESGNGRVLGIKKAFAQGKGENYREFITRKAADFGIDPKDIQNLSVPVLVRVRKSELDRAQFTRESNQSNIAELSPAEQANVDSQRITDDDLLLFNPSEDGNVLANSNQQFIQKFLKGIGDQETAGLLNSEGRPNKQLADRINAAIFAKVYENENLISLQAEEADVEIRNIVNALTIAAPQFAKAKAFDSNLAGLNVTQHIADAAQFVRDAKNRGQSVNQLLSQQDAFSQIDTDTSAFIRFMAANNRSSKRMGEAFRTIGKHLENELEKAQSANLFGDQIATLQQIIEATDKVIEVKHGGSETISDLFSQAQSNQQTVTAREQGRESTEDQRNAVTPSRTAEEEVTEEDHEPLFKPLNKEEIELRDMPMQDLISLGESMGIRPTNRPSLIDKIVTKRKVKNITEDTFTDESISTADNEQSVTNPIPKNASVDAKLDQLEFLTKKNQPIIKKIMAEIDRRTGAKSTDNKKSRGNIFEKANRPSIKKKKPWYGIEHIRDSYRFKTVINDFSDIGTAMEVLKENKIEIIKIDTDKMFKPGPWGWRFVGFDLKMPNGQLVEYYLPFTEVDQAKKNGNHDLFEKWRNLDESNLNDEQLEKRQADIFSSYDKYSAAFQAALGRLEVSETDALASFNSLVASFSSTAEKSSISDAESKRTDSSQSPLTREKAELPDRTRTSSGSESLRQASGLSDKGITSTEIIAKKANKSNRGKVAFKLRKSANTLAEKANEKLNQDRLTNTARRARMAHSAESQARGELQIAETMRNLADAIEQGLAVTLDKVSAKTHVELLNQLAVHAQLNRIQKRKDRSQSTYDKERAKPIDKNDIKHAAFPEVGLFKNVMSSIANSVEEHRGGKKIAEQLRTRLNKLDDEGYYIFKSKTDLDLARKIIKILRDNRENHLGWQLRDSMQNIDRLAKIGITNQKELKSALNEFIEFRSGVKKEDPIKIAERKLIGTKIPGFFPTPDPVIDRMFEVAGIEPNMDILEPSAGNGAIADRIKKEYGEITLDAIEINSTLRDVLKLKDHNLVANDFLSFNDREYDIVLMNPPFERAQDIDHVMHAYSLLRPGGKVVAIMGEGTFFRNTKKEVQFREWLDEIGGVSEKLPEGSFSKTDIRSTGVNSRLVVIDKPGQLAIAAGQRGSLNLQVLERLAEMQPIDAVFRIPFQFMRIDQLTKNIHDHAKRLITESSFKNDGFMSWANPIIETARAGIIDRYGLDQDFVKLDMQRENRERQLMMEGQQFIEDMESRGINESEAKVLHAVITGEEIEAGDWANVAEPIRKAIDEMGQEAVLYGLIDEATYQRHRGKYLHRVYAKHETDQTDLGKWLNDRLASRRKRIVGNQFKGRGIDIRLTQDRLLKVIPETWWQRKLQKGQADKALKDQEFFVFKRYASTGEGTLSLMEGSLESTPRTHRLLETVYWPADIPVPNKYNGWENNGKYQVRDVRGQTVILWRDYTKTERDKMGEILDARFTVAKTYQLMSKDLATGKFLKDISENEAWARTEEPDSWTNPSGRLSTYTGYEWVKVPDSSIPGSKTKRWGALSGKYVRSEIWRDLNELDRLQQPGLWKSLLTQWKLNKTARNPVVHMNNIMSNFLLMDMIDVRAIDFARALNSYATKDSHYQDALAHGAFGSDFITQDIQRQILDPILDEIKKQNRTMDDTVEGKFKMLDTFRTALWKSAKNLDKKFIDTYRLEDEVFRLAAYVRRLSLGDSQELAAQIARDQFLNYNIRAPWVNAMRGSFLPFISYTYRAVPVITKSIAERPWKLAKYAAVAHAAIILAYEMAPGDEDEERRVMNERVKGYTWVGVPRMIRMPFRDQNDNPVFMDIRRWIPAGDVFDMNQGQSPIPIPAPLQFSGPLMLAAELFLNKQAFTGKEIVNEKTDTQIEQFGKVGMWAWRSWMPSAPWIPGSWYWDKIDRAISGGRDLLGRLYSVPLAALSSVGIKLQPLDLTVEQEFRKRELDGIRRAILFEVRQLERDHQRKLIDEKEFKKQMESYESKMKRLSKRADKTIGNRAD